MDHLLAKPVRYMKQVSVFKSHGKCPVSVLTPVNGRQSKFGMSGNINISNLPEMVRRRNPNHASTNA